MEPIRRRSSLFIVVVAVVINVNELLAAAGPHDMDKRQPIPMPRIGRSASSVEQPSSSSSSSSYYYSNKRQSLIPAPRIGRRSVELTPDSTVNGPNDGGYELGGANNEDLIEPLDIQLRAAFIPRLGKRSSSSAAARTQQPIESDQSSDDLIDIYRPGTVGGKVFGLLTRQQQQQQSQQQPFDDQDPSLDTLDESDIQRLVMLRNWLIQNSGFSGSKRAALYTPRIGRAVFAPRIGKKAAFVPRIG